MSTAPRAARKGGKVATETTPPLPTQTSEVVMSPFDLPSPAAPAPSVVTDANLFSSFMQNADSIATAAPIGGGVVRGRGLTTNLKEIAASADRSDVESRVKAAIESIVPPPPAVGLINLEADAAQLKHITHNDVTLASDFDRLSVAVKLAQANGKHRILVISPYVALTDAGLCATALNTKVGETVGVWDGSYHAGNNKCKIMFTTLANFMLYLKKVRSTPGFGVFTHLMFSGCVHAGRAIPDLDLALSVLRDELRNTKRELSPRVIICGATRDDLNSFFEPLKCAELHSQNGARKGSLTVFTPDETAALCEVSMKTTTGSAIPRGPTTAAEPIPTRIIEHANDTARLVLHLLMEHFDASKPMRAIVFSAEPAELEKVLRHANISEQADIVTSLSAFESNELPRNTIAILSSSTPESVASSVRANVVVDLGMEKRLVAAPAAEATLPLKATVRATSREVNSRLHMLGWGSSGIAFQVLAGPPATAACEEDQQATVTSCVLRAIRNELPVANCRETLFRATLAHHAAVEAGLASLTEQCAITAVDRPSVTFLGDLLARLPLSTDAGLIVVHGVVFGVPELAAAVAASALIDVRGHCPSGVEATAWLARCASFAETVRASRFSDTLVGATLIISAAKRSSIETVATETGANPVLLSRAVDVFKSTCQELKDFAYVSPSTEAQLLAQLEKFQNHFIYVIAASLSRNAVVVRAEADELRASSERANMMMQRTTKEVARNKFSPSNVTWALQKIVVPAHITNTQGRLIASNVSTLSHAFFHSSLLLLHPALSFDLVNEETVIFCATVNRNPKRLTTDVATSAKILDFREKWCLLLGAAMLRRSLPRDTTPAQLQTLVSVNHKRLDIATLRDELSSAFVQLVQDIESKEPQIAPQLSRTNLLTATPLADVAAVPGSNDEVLQRVFDGKAALHGAETITPEPEPSTQFDDDVEVEGATFAPIIEED